MQEYFRVSPPSVHQMVLTLERAGFIRRQPRVARSIEMLVDACQSYFDPGFNLSKSLCSGTSWPMSAPVLLGYAEGGDYTERKKDRTQDNVPQNPREACAEERQGGDQSKVARLGVQSRSD